MAIGDGLWDVACGEYDTEEKAFNRSCSGMETTEERKIQNVFIAPLVIIYKLS